MYLQLKAKTVIKIQNMHDFKILQRHNYSILYILLLYYNYINNYNYIIII